MNNNTRFKASFAKWVVYSVALLLLLVMQNTLALHVSNICLILPAIIVISLNDDSDTGLILGGVFGLLWDITAGTLFGYNALLMIIFAFAAQIVAANLIRVKLVTNMLTAVVFAAIYQIITYFFFFVIWGDGGAWYTIFLALLRSSISAAISATAMLFIFRLLSHSLSDSL